MEFQLDSSKLWTYLVPYNPLSLTDFMVYMMLKFSVTITDIMQYHSLLKQPEASSTQF
jgi:hypothetical protein